MLQVCKDTISLFNPEISLKCKTKIDIAEMGETQNSHVQATKSVQYHCL